MPGSVRWWAYATWSPNGWRWPKSSLQSPDFRTRKRCSHKTRPDVVSIATLPSSHRNLAVMCLEAGCHVLCEKPVALDAGEARDMVHVAEANNRLLSICFEYRTWDESRYLRDRIADGVLVASTPCERGAGVPTDCRRERTGRVARMAVAFSRTGRSTTSTSRSGCSATPNR